MSEETVPCGLCGKPTRMTGTKRCDGCWELESRIQGDPVLAAKILAACTQVKPHIHRCMSCNERWYCPHTPSDCKAGFNVLPSLTLRGPDGPTVFHHACPDRKQT